MIDIILVFELYATDGGGMGWDQGTLGWYQTREDAVKAAHQLGHGYWSIRDDVLAIRLDDGTMYALRDDNPIKFGLKLRAAPEKGKPLPLP